MNKNISVCGSDCAVCYCRDQCEGCNTCHGVAFHCSDRQECAIYHCCVTQNGYQSCLDCPHLPCTIWQKTRDPKFSDEEFDENIRKRIDILKANQ